MGLGELDLYLFGNGKHRQAYRHLGAHPGIENGNAGTHFAVWAPSAVAVSVITDSNHWSPGPDPLEPTGSSGIWQGFIAGVSAGAVYKFAIRPYPGAQWLEKSDPFAFQAELRPHTGSVVADLEGYGWSDEEWMVGRTNSNPLDGPISIYEVHLSSWRRDPASPDRFLTYRELGEQLPAYCVDMGYTHIELLPVAEHPLDMSWGYQTVGYFAPTSRFGTPTDFMYFVDRCHQAGLGVIFNWVPAHFPKDAHGLGQFDGSHLFEHADPRQGEHPDWGTYVFNYGRAEVRSFLLSNALFWLDYYHVDGFRVDAVASMLYLDYSREAGEWIPNQYGGRENLEAISLLQEVNLAAHDAYPGILTAAEESTAWPKVTGSVDHGGLGFDLKWNMGWMHDTLQYFEREPIHRKHHHGELTFSLMYAFSERFVLPLSHDEVVHGKGSLLGKMPGDVWQKFANLRLLLAYMWAHPGKKLLFMGQEFAQWSEWKFDHSLDWHLLHSGDDRHRGVQLLVRDLNDLLRRRHSMWALDFDWTGFEWIDFLDADNSVIAFQRLSPDGEHTIFVANLTPVVREDYRIGLPSAGRYRETLNTDSHLYGGSNVGNEAEVHADPVPWHGQPFSAMVVLPPLALFVLEPQ